MKIFDLTQIQASINIKKDFEELVSSQKSAFIDFSFGLYDVPPPMQFIFANQGSDCHIKGGYRKGSQYFVIKVAGSSKFGNNGAVFVLDVATCEIKAVLEDKGFLTTLRTAMTGMIVLGLIHWKPQNIGIIGSGNLAQQLYSLATQKYTDASIMLYARNKVKAADISELVCDSVEDLVTKCDIIFTATSSTHPIIHALPRDKNILIIALGSDDEHKSEIASNLFENADMVIVDSKLQAAKFGDVSRALKAGIIDQSALIDLGKVLQSGTTEKSKIIIADFSGIGAQDVAMAEFILSRQSIS